MEEAGLWVLHRVAVGQALVFNAKDAKDAKDAKNFLLCHPISVAPQVRNLVPESGVSVHWLPDLKFLASFASFALLAFQPVELFYGLTPIFLNMIIRRRRRKRRRTDS